MERQYLSIYLHDHLAGSTGALVLLSSLEKTHKNSPVGKFVKSLREEISWEREQLEKLCKVFPTKSAIPRRMAAWFAEKGLEMKLSFDGGSHDDFQLFESLEALSVGIAGKRLLWRMLKQHAKTDKRLSSLDYPKLIRMSIRQRKELEPFRLMAGKTL